MNAIIGMGSSNVGVRAASGYSAMRLAESCRSTYAYGAVTVHSRELGCCLDRRVMRLKANFLSVERETMAAQGRYLLANREMKQLNLVHGYAEVSRRQCRRSRSPLIIMSTTTVAFPFSPVLFILRHPLWLRCELDPGATGYRRAGTPPNCMIAHRSDVGR